MSITSCLNNYVNTQASSAEGGGFRKEDAISLIAQSTRWTFRLHAFHLNHLGKELTPDRLVHYPCTAFRAMEFAADRPPKG